MSADAGPSNYYASAGPSPAPSPAYTPGSALPFAPPMPPPTTTSFVFPSGPSQGNKRPRDGPRRGVGRGRGRGGGRGGLAFDRGAAGPSTGLRRTTRQTAQTQKVGGDAAGRRVKLRLGGTLKGKARAGFMYETPYGWYDRGLDEDKDEPSVYEEQFILRVNKDILHGNPGKGIKGLREAVLSRKAVEGVAIKWKDDRRAMFSHHDKLYAAKMVDLPCIIESQKIMDNKRLFKVADISQMLVVGEQIRSEEELEGQPKPTQEELTWPDGLTAAMRNVRQERWRHRIDLGSDATVVDAVERLMKQDAAALVTKSHFVPAASLLARSSVEPQQPAATPQDDYMMGLAAPSPAASTPAGSHGREHRAGTSGRESYAGDDDVEGEYRGRETTVDQEQDIVKRFNERMQRDAEGQAEGQRGDNDDLFGESDDEDEEEEDVDEVSDAEEDETAGLDKEDQELIKQQNKLAGEINDLEDAVKRKRVEVQGKQNRTLRERANIQLQKMIKELDSKRAEHDAVVSQRSTRQEQPAGVDAAAPTEDAAAPGDGEKADEDQGEDDDDSLFGESEHDEDEAVPPADADDDAEGEEDTDAMATVVAQSAATLTANNAAVETAPADDAAPALVIDKASSDAHMSPPEEATATATPAEDAAMASPQAPEAESAPMARSTSQVEPAAVFDYEFSEPSGSDDDD